MPPSESPANPAPVRVLLVDDHEDTNRSLMLLLSRRGYRVRTATTITQAELIASEEEFDVLISDMNLPDGSGLGLLKKLGARGPRYGGIMVSGCNTDDDIDRSVAAGYATHLGKPTSLERLDATIRRMVAAEPVTSADESAIR